MNNELEIKELSEESTKTRKRKLLTNSESLWARCQICREPGNLENLIRKAIAVKNSAGVELYQSFNYVYFCSLTCELDTFKKS